MNAAQKQSDSPSPESAQSHPQVQTLSASMSSLSALVDGEAQDAELDWLLGEQLCNSEALELWNSYQVIGDVLRASAPVVAKQAPSVFLAAIHARLPVEAPSEQPVVVSPVLLTAPPTAQVGPVRAPAANDAVFRWKMLAGFASLAAVMAVSWTVLGTVPVGAGSPSRADAQFVLTGVSPGVAIPQTHESAAVAVNTPQGTLIRDAQLEALMAEHRQYGGMSALQMPAGFLRNATYDASGR